MAGTDIKLTPEESLIAQSTELTSLQTEFESVFSQLTSTFELDERQLERDISRDSLPGKFRRLRSPLPVWQTCWQTAPLQHGFPRVRLHHRVRCWQMPLRR